nr:ferrous iron transport protein B [Prolixibacteraceae bacterium]
MITLDTIKTGEKVIVKCVLGRSSFKRRITEMGFVRGKEIFVKKNAPFKDPIEYQIMGYNISLRRSEAALIEVEPVDKENGQEPGYFGTLKFSKQADRPANGSKKIRVVFVGNPNSGKTSLYNALTGRQEHVGNYPGVTVDARNARLPFKGYELEITDLPGTYSLSPDSPDELFVRDYILKQHPDVVVNVVDASNMERNLYLTCQLIDMDIQVVIALNMYDELQKNGDCFDQKQFSTLTGIPLVPTVGSRGEGAEKLRSKIVDVVENRDPHIRHIHINYGSELEQSINTIQKVIWQANNYIREYSSRYFALRLLEKDEHTRQNMAYLGNSAQIFESAQREIARLESLINEDTQTLITQARYGFINGALKETLKKRDGKARESVSDRIDRVLTGKYTGFPIFLLFLWLMFQGTFSLGAYPADWIDLGVSWLGGILRQLIPAGPARDLLVEGVISGVGGVLVFLPNIVILFFFISIMEDTGYMARVAFIMDKLMHLIGLHGKSFIPLIMGFGCNVPAIMATRTLQNRSDRMLTMLIIPFMSCSARLPVYILIAGAIFPGKAGSVIFLIYLTGIVISILTALLLKRTLFRAQEAPFVMELPPYRVPTLKSTLRHMWNKAREYLKKMAGIILWASIIVWFLSYFPRDNTKRVAKERQQNRVSGIQETASDNRIMNDHVLPADTIAFASQTPEVWQHDEQQNPSYLEQLGRVIEPVLRPIGFDWKIGVSLLSGIVAKEIVVSTLGVLYAGDDDRSLRSALQSQVHR